MNTAFHDFCNVVTGCSIILVRCKADLRAFNFVHDQARAIAVLLESDTISSAMAIDELATAVSLALRQCLVAPDWQTVRHRLQDHWDYANHRGNVGAATTPAL